MFIVTCCLSHNLSIALVAGGNYVHLAGEESSRRSCKTCCGQQQDDCRDGEFLVMSLILDLLNLFHTVIYTCIYCMILHRSGNAVYPVYEILGTVDGTRLNIIFLSIGLKVRARGPENSFWVSWALATYSSFVLSRPPTSPLIRSFYSAAACFLLLVCSLLLSSPVKVWKAWSKLWKTRAVKYRRLGRHRAFVFRIHPDFFHCHSYWTVNWCEDMWNKFLSKLQLSTCQVKAELTSLKAASTEQQALWTSPISNPLQSPVLSTHDALKT